MASQLQVDTITNAAGTGAPAFSQGFTTAKATVIDGSADEIQERIQGHSTQTNNILVVEKSDGTDIFQVSNAAVLAPLQPSFMNRKSTAQTGLTSAAETTISYPGADDHDTAGNFASNTFTAPIAGRYLFCLHATVTADTGFMTNINIQIKQAGSVTRTYRIGNWFTNGTSIVKEHAAAGAVVIVCAVNDTITTSATVTTSVGTYSISADPYTAFSGHFLG